MPNAGDNTDQLAGCQENPEVAVPALQKAKRRTPFGRMAFPGARKRFATGLGWGIIRAHGNKQAFEVN
jgi:hypothetical protein